MLNAIVGLYYYLMVIRVMFLFRAEPEVEAIPIPVPRSYGFAVAICIAGIIALGVYATPLYKWASEAAAALF